MKALQLSQQNIEVIECETPEPKPSEALIKVDLAGVCDTDLQLRRGYMNFQGIPGHEFVGTVEQCADETWLGQKVVGEINAACTLCPTCLAGRQRHCPQRTVLGILGRSGAHAEYLTLPTRNLLEVPKNVSLEQAVFTEPLAAACEILEQIHIKPRDKVAVVGDGKLGLLISQVLALTGCELTVIGRHESKLAILQDRGIDTEVVAKGEVSKRPAAWADIVVECTGHPSGFAAARRLLRARGSFVLKTTVKDQFQVDLADLVINEITLLGSRCGPFDAALRLLHRELVDVDSLIHSRHPLSEGPSAYHEASQRGVLKVLLDPSPS